MSTKCTKARQKLCRGAMQAEQLTRDWHALPCSHKHGLGARVRPLAGPSTEALHRELIGATILQPRDRKAASCFGCTVLPGGRLCLLVGEWNQAVRYAVLVDASPGGGLFPAELDVAAAGEGCEIGWWGRWLACKASTLGNGCGRCRSGAIEFSVHSLHTCHSRAC